jgi:GTP-binding protein HflX
MNRLTGARLHAADQLFVTLDPAARLVDGTVGNGKGHRVRTPFILTDTVGFIRKLPHELVAAFRATLEELSEADVLLHVVDASQAALEEHMAAVESLLEELRVSERPTIVVLNKMDRVTSERSLESLATSRRRVVGVSAATGEGMEALLGAIDAALKPSHAGAVSESG